VSSTDTLTTARDPERPPSFADFLPLPASPDDNVDDDCDYSDAIAAELSSTDSANDPRALKYRDNSLDEYLRSEVRRSIHRIRMLRRVKRPLDSPMPTASELRKLGRALGQVAFTKAQLTAARELEAVERELPEIASAIKYHCAEEACYLIGCFSRNPRADLKHYESGAFLSITKKLYEAVTGETDADVNPACDHVRRNWRLFCPDRKNKNCAI
jgi:hypothetical protein